MRVLMLLVLAGASGCISGPKLTDGGKLTRVVTESPHGCEYKGQIEQGPCYGNLVSETGGHMSDEDARLVNLRNKTSAIGGNAFQLIKINYDKYLAEAYFCPAAK